MPEDVLTLIEKHAVVPAIVLEDANRAAPLAHALISGGLPVAEVTMRTPSALESMRRMATFGELLVGAGTVLNATQAEQAVAAGAKFIVSPGMDADLVRWCQQKEIPIIPGAVTATEVMLATNLGLGCVKFFPCSTSGGLDALRALHGPFPAMRFMPTGGIKMETVQDYLAFKAVVAVGGTWMLKPEWLANDRYDVIEDACRATVSAVNDARRKIARSSATA